MSTSADIGSFIESKTSVVQTSNVGFTPEVPDYLVVHTGLGDVAGRLPEDVASPTPLSSTDLCGNWFLICCLQVLVSDLLWPQRRCTVARVVLYASGSQEYRFHICVEYPHLGEFSNILVAPDFVETQESTSRCAYS